MQQATISDDAWLPSSCDICSTRCGLRVHRRDGVVVRIEGDPDCPLNEGRLCAKGNSTLLAMYNPNRVDHPLRRTNPEKGIGVDPRWERVTWEEALDILVARLKAVREDNPLKLLFSSKDSSVTDQVAGAWTSAFGGRQTLTSSFAPGPGKHVMTYPITGTFQQGVDLAHCRYLMLWGNQLGFGTQKGANLFSREMADARTRGLKLVVIDPVLNQAAAKADEWVPIRPGTDAALALAMANLMVNDLGLYDAEFLKHHSNGAYLIGPDGLYVRDPQTARPLVWDTQDSRTTPFDEAAQPALEGELTVNGVRCQPAFQRVKQHLKKYTPDYAATVTTVPAVTIARLAREYAEAASIGSTIVLEGQQLPYRPAASLAFSGVVRHAHSALNGWSVQLLNVLIGNVYVPGGTWGFNLVGPQGMWGPESDPDGMLMPPHPVSHGINAYTHQVKAPEGLGCRELFPLGNGTNAMFLLNMGDEGRRRRLPPEPEVLINCRSNFMLLSTNREQLADVLKRLSFVVCFAQEIDEVGEFADLVLPDTHQLERLILFPNDWYTSIPSSSDFMWRIHVPVVDPPGQARMWRDILLELAERLGFTQKLNTLLNSRLGLKEDFRLDPHIQYGYPEIADRWARSQFGPENGLEWMRWQVNVRVKRKVDEEYPLRTMRARIPLYHEIAQRRRPEIEAVATELGIPWDVSDYQPIPDWKPEPSFSDQDPDRDLVAVTYKFPFHAHSVTPNNPWLQELTERHRYGYNILVNVGTAARKGIKDGALICVESATGKVQGRARVIEGIHPEVVAIGGSFGSWATGKPVARGKGVHFGALLPVAAHFIDHVSGQVDGCIRVKVYPAAKG
ncbi:MAG: molybdopterin-dependent oxidoreductase [Chloroflexi bacterium]|nr:molybdopterin-dependent oxidoreductase [Chloroflexota bacterium]